MNKKNDPNTKHYFQITNEKELAAAIQENLRAKAELKLTLWEKGEEEKDAEIYSISGFDALKKFLKITPTGKLLTTITGSPKTGKLILVKIPINNKTNFFTGGPLQYHRETLSYSVHIEQDIFISQQRSNFRLNANNVIQIQFKLNNIVYDAMDISVGGTSFKIANTNLDEFAKGQIFDDCTLRFDRKNYHIPKAIISSLMPILDDSGKPTDDIKIGIAFKDLHSNVVDELNIKIQVEARGDEMKKKFDAIFEKAGS
jgi:hypothetical protein